MKKLVMLMTLLPASVIAAQTSQLLNVYVINLQAGSSYTLPGASSPCPVIAGGVNLTAANPFTASVNLSSGSCVYTVSGTASDSINLTLIGAAGTGGGTGGGGGTQTVATPTATPSAGSYSSAQTVTLATSTSGAAIYYTTDGSIPTSSSTLYSSPISISTTQTIKAIAVESGSTNSSVLTASYAISTATTTTLSASTSTPTSGTSVTFTATVSPSTSTGTVTFSDGPTTLGTGTLSSGTATYSTSALSPGTHTISAAYGGDSFYNPSASTSLTVTVAASSYTDTFPSTTHGTPLSINWTQTSLTGYVPVVQDGYNDVVASDNSSPAEAIYTGGPFSADQYAQVVFIQYSSNSGLVVRMTPSGNGYVWQFGNGRLYRMDSGVWTQIGGCPDASSYNPTNDVMKLSVTGGTIVCSDVTAGLSGTATDSTYTAGNPGIFISSGSEVGTFTGGSN